MLSNKRENKYPGAYSLKLAHKSNTLWDGKENVEKFKMRTRGFLGVGSSKSVCENFVYCSSPFMNRDFFVYCLEKIPYNLRKGHYIYKKWVLTKHSEAAKIPMQRYNGGLMTEGRVLQTIRKIKRIGIRTSINWLLYKMHLKKELNRKIVRTSMNPFDLWLSENVFIKNNLKARFERNIKLLHAKKLIGDILFEDTMTLYRDGTATEKTQALTVVEAMVQLFLSGEEKLCVS